MYDLTTLSKYNYYTVNIRVLDKKQNGFYNTINICIYVMVILNIRAYVYINDTVGIIDSKMCYQVKTSWSSSIFVSNI